MSQYKSHTKETEKDLYETPSYLYRWQDSYNDFYLDLAASSKNKKCKYFIDKEEDSFTIGWGDFCLERGINSAGWLNPPYSRIAPWLYKAVDESKNGFKTVMLIETPNGQDHYRDVFNYAREIIFINGRISFIASHDMEKKNKHGEVTRVIKKGEEVSGNTRGSCIVIFEKHFGSIRLSHVNRDDLIEEFG